MEYNVFAWNALRCATVWPTGPYLCHPVTVAEFVPCEGQPRQMVGSIWETAQILPLLASHYFFRLEKMCTLILLFCFVLHEGQT